LQLERRSIDLFRRTAEFFSSSGEAQSLADDVITLLVLRHYGVPTRLLNWSSSPYVAAFFSLSDHGDSDGELWTFDEPLYELKGKEQWRCWPETTSDRSGEPDQFKAGLTAFMSDEPPDWIIAVYYPRGFPRQNAQSGAYTMTARFGVDHGEAMGRLLANESEHHQYLIKAGLKKELRTILREQYSIWRGSLFPDSAGAADTARCPSSEAADSACGA
jgi:hypothetical protein